MREHADPDELGLQTSEYQESLRASVFDVLSSASSESALDLRNVVGVKHGSWDPLLNVEFSEAIVLFLLATLICGIVLARRRTDCRPLIALIAATWFSVLAPLSWLVIFKAHAQVHSLDVIVWHMPFIPFGFALCGLSVVQLSHWIRSRISASG